MVGVRVQPEAPAVEPAEVGGGRERHPDPGEPLRDERVEEVAVAFEMREERVEPLVALGPRDAGRLQAEAAHRAPDALRPRLEALREPVRAEDRHRAAKARDVEGLGRARHGEGARLHLRAEGGEGDVPGAGVDDVRVDLVRDHHEVALDGERRQRLELLPLEDPAERVVGGAEEEEAGALVDGGAERVEVDLVAVPAPRHRAGVEAAPGLGHRLQEGGVYRGQGADPVPGPGVRLDREVDALHHVRDRDHPLRRHRPPREAARREARERLPEAARGRLRRVAEVVRVHHPREAVADGPGHVEVHVRHPGRQHVRRVAGPLVAPAPAERFQGYRVEVGRLAQSRAPSRARAPAPAPNPARGAGEPALEPAPGRGPIRRRDPGRSRRSQRARPAPCRAPSRRARRRNRGRWARPTVTASAAAAGVPGFRYHRAFAGRTRENDRPWDSAPRTSL